MFKPRKRSDYQWIRVPSAAAAKAEPGFATRAMAFVGMPSARSTVALSRFSFARALAEVGVPTLPDKSPEEELVQLLQDASEIEHGLMLTYLYASYSLKVPNIQGMIRMIAIEEMGHFITVQNLLAACGGAFNFDRNEWGRQTFFHPFAFRLEPASVGSLAKYAVAEMPDSKLVPDNIKLDMPTLIAEADAAAGSKVEANRVGLLYARIYWLLRQSDAPLADPTKEPWPGFPVAEMAATPGLAGRHVRDGFVTDARSTNTTLGQWAGNFASVIVEPISGRDAALGAIEKIAAQGEGFADNKQGHFERFVAAWRLAKSAPDLALPMAVNPFYRIGEETVAAGNEITSADGRQFALLSDKVYELVLLCIAAHLLLPAGTTPAIRIKPSKAAIAAMRDGLGTLAGILPSIPVSDQNPEPVCGLPFTVPTAEMTPDVASVVRRARQAIAEARGVIDSIVQGNASEMLKLTAQGIGDMLGDPIATALDALPT